MLQPHAGHRGTWAWTPFLLVMAERCRKVWGGWRGIKLWRREKMHRDRAHHWE